MLLSYLVVSISWLIITFDHRASARCLSLTLLEALLTMLLHVLARQELIAYSTLDGLVLAREEVRVHQRPTTEAIQYALIVIAAVELVVALTVVTVLVWALHL